MPRCVLVTGASGFVGRAVVRQLLAGGWQVHALVNRTPLDPQPGLRSIGGDLFDTHALDQAAVGCQAAIHLVGIIREHPRRHTTYQRIHIDGTQSVVDAIVRAGIPRLVHMSALGARPDAPSAYHRSKDRAEQIVKHSPTAWTIFRPSLIHGPGGQFMQMEAQWAHGRRAPWLFMPYFGSGPMGTAGSGRVQPIYVRDVARAFVQALDNPRAVGKTYPIGGADRLDWAQMHRIAAQTIVGRPRAVVAVPSWYAILLTRLLPQALLPFTREQVLMSLEDNTADVEAFVADFGFQPAGFGSALSLYASQM